MIIKGVDHSISRLEPGCTKGFGPGGVFIFLFSGLVDKSRIDVYPSEIVRINGIKPSQWRVLFLTLYQILNAYDGKSFQILNALDVRDA